LRLINNIKITIIFFVLLQLIGCNKTNWQENYKKISKDPFGLYIFHNELESLMENKKKEDLGENINDFLYDNYIESNPRFGTYLCIKNTARKLNEQGVERLLSFVYDGNNAFLSLNSFNYLLESRLGFTYENHQDYLTSVEDLKGNLYLKNTSFKGQPYFFDRNLKGNYFSDFNSNTTIVLGTHEINNKKQPNFIKIYHGKGAIYLHSNPIVFTNYYMLKNKENYVESILSYIPSSEILWDPQIKSSKIAPKEKNRDKSVFSFFLEHKTLTWFLYVSLFGLLSFLIFNARRKQRAIPIIKPLDNTTVAFTQTIASLYLKEENHKNLVDKKINFFLEKIRTNYLIDTNNLNASFIEKLASKSGNELQKTKYLIHSIIDLNKKSECTEEHLVVLHRMIDNFFKKTE